MKKKLIIAGTIVVVLAVIIIVNLKTGDRSSVSVQTQKVKRGDIAHIVSASGNIQPKHSVDISADVAGKITKLFINEGDEVTKGDTLLLIDPAPYEAELAREQAQLAGYQSELIQAERNLERALEIYRSQTELGGESLISEEELEQVKTEYEVAKQRVEGARASTRRAQEYLKKITVTAPMSGIVTSLDVEEGEVAVIGTMNNPGTVLLTISDLSEMEAEIKVDETDIVDISIDQKAVVKIDAYPDTSFSGIVSEIGNSPIISTRGAVGVQEAVDFLVKVALTDPPQKLKPGLSATAEITTSSKENTLIIPIQAITIRSVSEGSGEAEEAEAKDEKKKEKKGVFLIEDGVAKFKPIRTGIVGGMEIEVIDGVKEGEEIVIGSFKVLRTLEDNTKVKIEKIEKKGKEE